MKTADITLPGIPESKIRFREIVPGGGNWSHVLKRGTTLRLMNPRGGLNAAAIFFNFELPSERFNLPDTLKAQHTAKLTTGHCLYSDMGRILVSIPRDTAGWHDPLTGPSTPETIHAAFGPKSFQEARNHFHRNARDNFLVELGKYNLGRRDLVMNVNFFSKVAVDNEGQLNFHPGHAQPGSFIDLRAEMNTLVILNTCPHPLSPAGPYDPAPLHLAVFTSDPVADDDPCRISCPENQRGFELTERYFL
ncbi:MAG: urea carboxylase-associated family protein [Candidatus Methylacidiphilales bacterium]|nr:urea carboxylase-associated family protein [Candidatus Methylacidiphilales bacterium]